MVNSSSSPSLFSQLEGKKNKRDLSSSVYVIVLQWLKVMSDSLQPHGLQHARLPCPSPSPRACSNSYPLSWWCHATISLSVVQFSCPQSFPASGSFQMSQFIISGGQRIGFSFNISPSNKYSGQISFLGWTGWISLLFKGLSRFFSNTTVQKYQFFGAQLSL